ncbi:hypothetical protein [Vibrio algivorus]|uniref:YtxH domain-containing protein n=1 Tax=Vibrio algivorus TaxID=1667024 RepID=A0ABQ6ESZ7_9VIBR|nr:hypothetical protein [Vibrio algivorus]GLT16154.1 hypothetical protein GCM10007931_31300 [Vibrio algivorus]
MISEKEKLAARLEAKKKEFEADLAKAKADSLEDFSQKSKELEEKIKKTKAHLKDVTHNFTEDVAKRVNDWLK